jgi:DNA-directed RNA polymerase, mitochondrial
MYYLSVEAKSDTKLSAFLDLLKPDKLALIVILELMRLQGSGGIAEGMKTARALVSVGKAVEMEYDAHLLRKQDLPVLSPTVGQGSNGLAALQARRVAAKEQEGDMRSWAPAWTQAVRVRVGSFLVDALMDVAVVRRTAPDPRGGED